MNKIKKNNSNIAKFRQLTLLFTLIVIVVFFSLQSPFFLTKSNLLNIMRQVSATAICAVGMTMIIILGDIDLSVGSMLAFLSVLGAMVYNAMSGMDDVIRSICSLLVVILAGAGLGFSSGYVTAKGKIPAFVTTLALMSLLRGFGFIITGGSPIPISDTAFKYFGSGWILDFIPVPVLLMIIFVLLGVFLTKYTRFGRHIYAIGGNEQASSWSGINTARVKIIVFTIAGALYGLAAMILAGRLGGGYPATATGFEMDVIAGTILGGTSLSGGKGKILGTLLGIIIIGVINNGLTLLDISTYWQQVIMGIIILGAVLIDTRNKQKASA